MGEAKYYDGTKLLSMSDIHGNRPELYLCCGNRTGGKTVYFNRLAVNRYLKSASKFMLVYRYSYELDDVAEKFFKEIQRLFFPGHEMTSEKRMRGAYCELSLDEIPCGYAVALNGADNIKKISHVFGDVDTMIFDEFQSETNHYCSDEVSKLISIHTSVARGKGEQWRYVPVYMLSNAVSIINPYFVELGISARLKSDTKFLRGDGYVLEQAYIDSAAKAQAESGFMKAFSGNKYTDYAMQNVYLNDNTSFIERPEGKGRYICTLRYKDRDYAVREYGDAGVMYCDTRADASFPTRIAVTTADHRVNYVMLRRSDFLISNLRYLFDKGCFRFKDLQCKEAVLKALSY